MHQNSAENMGMNKLNPSSNGRTISEYKRPPESVSPHTTCRADSVGLALDAAERWKARNASSASDGLRNNAAGAQDPPLMSIPNVSSPSTIDRTYVVLHAPAYVRSAKSTEDVLVASRKVGM